MTATIRGVDCSSNNPVRTQDQVNQWVAEGCQVLMVKSYSHVETPGLDQTTREWCAFARAAGLWHLPYVWLYSSNDPGDQVRSALATWRSAGEVPGVLAIDAEEYQGDPGPSVDQILAAVEACHAENVNAIGYSRASWLNVHPDADRLAVIPWWLANYSIPPSLDIIHPLWATVISHQYTNQPVDWSLWDLSALQALAGGYVAPDPCQSLKSAIRAELDTISDAMDTIAAARGRLAALVG